MGVSEDVDQDRLTAVLDDPVNDYFFVSQFDELRGIIDDVIASVSDSTLFILNIYIVSRFAS